MNEWEFTAAAAGWINELIGKDTQLPFSAARCEQRGRDSLKRRDPTLLDRNRRIVLTGEVKLPYNKDGGSPHNVAVVRDVRAKARRVGTRYFFTWNVNEFVRGLVRVPRDESECRRVLGVYESFIGKRENLIRHLIEERTADEDLQKMIDDALRTIMVEGKT
jgi:hypothetical protein